MGGKITFSLCLYLDTKQNYIMSTVHRKDYNTIMHMYGGKGLCSRNRAVRAGGGLTAPWCKSFSHLFYKEEGWSPEIGRSLTRVTARPELFLRTAQAFLPGASVSARGSVFQSAREQVISWAHVIDPLLHTEPWDGNEIWKLLPFTEFYNVVEWYQTFFFLIIKHEIV